MSRHTKRLLLASAIIMASPLSIALADGQANNPANGNNSNPWSPNYQTQQFAPPQNMQAPRFQYNNQRMMPWGNNGNGNNNRGWGGGPNWNNGPSWGGGPSWNNGPSWGNGPAPGMRQQSRPPMPPPQMNRPNNAVGGPNVAPNSGPRNGMAPPPGRNPNNAQRMNGPRMNNGMRPPGYYTPGFNPGNDHWRNNNNKFWGRSGPSQWMNPNKRNMEQGWDDMINAPSRMGEMPGGWTAPEVSMPNPIDLGDQMQDNLQDLPEQMRNMDVGN